MHADPRSGLTRSAARHLALALVAALGFAACAPATEAPPTPPPASATAGSPAQTEAPAEGGTLRVAMEPIVATDPALISSDTEVLVANAVYDYLVDVDANNQILPRLATSWTTSDDGLSYTFTLAQGVTFHDGSPFTAQDVAWTFDRLRDPDSGFATVDLYSNVTSIEASGDLEVTFTLEKTNPFFLFDLSDNHALILKAGTEDPTDFNGTGPFTVANYSPEDRIELAAYDGYWGEGEPELSGVEILFFNDQAAMVDALRSGQVDIVMRLSTPLYQSLEGQAGVQRMQIATNAFPVVRLRADEPPGDDPNVMEAIRYAIDREAIFELVQQGTGAIGNDTPVGPLYEDLYAGDIPLPEHDVDRARQLLKDAGYENGLDLLLRLPEALNFPDLAVVLKDQLDEVGINVEVSVEPEEVYYADNGWLEATFGITGWGSRPYPQFYVDVMLVCGAKWNESHFCDDEFDQWAEVAGTTLDEGERQQAYHEMQRILIERGPILVPFYFPMLGAVSERVQGFEMKAFPGRSDFRGVSVQN